MERACPHRARPVSRAARVALAAAAVLSALGDEPAAQTAGEYDVEWTSPSQDSSGSMPLGNGDLALNVWVERGGDLVFYVSKSDAWSENGRLLKLGRVRVELEPNPFLVEEGFRQRLQLATGEIEVRVGGPNELTTLRIRVDAHLPLAHVVIESRQPVTLRASLEPWRTERRRLEGEELHSAYGLHGENPEPVFVEPDVVVAAEPDRLTWYHRNERSMWADNLRRQALGELVAELEDPLLRRTFGATLSGPGLARAGDLSLASTEPRREHALSLVASTARTESADEWRALLAGERARVAERDETEAREAHRAWWSAFWERSWIRLGGFERAVEVSRGYALQRFLHAAAGRGAQPIKFNGSLFTVDVRERGPFDADYRRWGGPYWWQNTRLPYWSMPRAGDYDLMEPLFRTYVDALPLARERTRRYFGHAGAFFPETMTFWGTYADANYGWRREGLPVGLTVNRYIRYEWQGAIELLAMMLEVWAHQGDPELLRGTLLPLAREVVTFYDRHYPRDDQGRIRFEPAQALETWWDVPNPLPEIAGLRHVLDGLLALPAEELSAEDRELWSRVRAELPELPMREIEDAPVLAPAERLGGRSNSENPELYAVFPYPLFGVGKGQLALARRTYELREPSGTGGWRQDAIWAARLGLAREAADMVTANFTTPHSRSRFPGFFGPNYDWVPDQDQGSVAMIALQEMLLQTDGRRILLFPAWPADWDVSFRLHAPLGTVVEGEYRGGEVRALRVDPPEREKDLSRLAPQ